MGRTDFISEIAPDAARDWRSGVFAIEDMTTGRRYYCASRCTGKRVWDTLNWLRRGVHRNAPLQRDWTSNPDAFRVVLVERVAVASLLNLVKQGWIDHDRASGVAPPYNKKNAVPRRRPSSYRTGISLMLAFPGKPPPELREAAYNRAIRLISETPKYTGDDLTPAQMRARAERSIDRVKMVLNRRDDGRSS